MISFGPRFFKADDRGAVAVTVALLGVVLTLAAGIGIDLARAYFMKSTAQESVDQAVIAAAAVAYSGPGILAPDETKMKEVVKAYLASNAGSDAQLAGMAEPKVSYQTDPLEMVTVSVGVSIETTFLRIANIDEINFTVSSSAKRPEPDLAAADLETRDGPLELALVVDRSWPMAGDFGGTTKIQALRAAATDLAERIMADDGAKLGIVPFGSWLSVERRLWMEPWLDRSNLSIPDGDACRPAFQRNCEPFGGWFFVSSRVTEIFIPEICLDYGPLTCEATASPTTFNGCFMTRAALPYSIESPTNPAYPAKPGPCLQTPILELTSAADLGGGGFDIVRNRIAQLVPVEDDEAGGTYIPGGLEFGWHMLAPGQPLDTASTPEQAQSRGVRKTMVLVSGGPNNVYPLADGGWGRYRSGASAVEEADPAQDADLSTKNLCSRIKDAGIRLYVVSLAVGDSRTDKMLQSCASGPSYFYQADSELALQRAFGQIGNRLAAPRLVN